MKHFHLAKRFAALFMLLSIATNVAFAGSRTVEQAKQAAKEQMSKHSARKVQGQKGIATIEPKLVFSKARHITQDNGAYYYVFSAGENCGYTIVSGDDRFPAIVGYTESGDYNADNLPTNFVSFMLSYQNFMDNATEEQITEISAKKTSNIYSPIEPFIETKWGQGEPYNDMCPLYDDNNRSVTGCVATAMAQILYYYKQPNELMENIPSYTGWEFSIQTPTISAGEKYDWDNMLLEYSTNATEQQKQAVAKLMLHAGCAAQMSYGPSSAADISAEYFTKYFGMDKELTRHLFRTNYTLQEWGNILYEEIAAKRPVLYAGSSISMYDHAFVIHGYDGDGLYAINWGWNGYCDGYFDITILNPYNRISSANDGYNIGNAMIIGIQPDNGEVDEVLNPQIGSYAQLQWKDTNISENTISGTVIINPLNKSLQGAICISIGYRDGEGSIVSIASSPIWIHSDYLPLNNYYPNVEMPCSFQYAENKAYKLYLIESKDANNWATCYDAEKTSIILKVQHKEALITEKADLVAIATLDIEKSSGLVRSNNSINVTVNNIGDEGYYEYYDKISVRTSTSPIMPNEDFVSQGITVSVGKSTTLSFVYSPQTAGTHYFWILDASGKEIGKSSIDFIEEDTPELTVTGEIDENKIKEVNKQLENNNVITSIDFSNATINTRTSIVAANPNMLIYLGKNSSIGNQKNVVKDGICENLELSDEAPFKANKQFTATSATYTRTLSAKEDGESGWYSICLPYAAEIPNDILVEKFNSVDTNNRVITFEPVAETTLEANKPYIFETTTDKVAFEATATEIAITTDEMNDGSFIGIYQGIEAPNLAGYYILKADGTGFAIASDKASASPFRGIIQADGLANAAMLRLVHGSDDNDTTIITEVEESTEKQGCYYNLQGIKVAIPTKGIYIKNGKKYIFK